MKRLLLTILFILACAGLKAQFSLTGSDPASARWMKMETPRFRLVFPEGTDSLARVYGEALEKENLWTGRRRMPIVLHAFYPIPNASVTWAPRRMDVFTVMDPYAPTPIPWHRLLAIHEGRHVRQMLSLEENGSRVLKTLFGEMYTGALSGLYPGPALLEGDAVVAETALSRSGRGRQASFLSYMVPAFDCGDWRDYWRWIYGSYRLYTPDHYKAGYMLVSGTRVFFDDPLFIDEYFSSIAGKGLFFKLQKTVRSATGNPLVPSFRQIQDRFHEIWSEDAALRGPFMEASQVTPVPWRHTEYSGTVIDGEGGIWSKKTGLTTPTSLVVTRPDGSEKSVRPFSAVSSGLFYDKNNGRIFWSETIPHWRWTLDGSSRIRYVETSDPGKIHDLTRKGRYFNPAPSPDGGKVCAVEYPVRGGSSISIFDAASGEKVKVIPAPDSLQFTEVAWVGERIFAAALSEGGMGIYEVGISGLRKVLGPQPVELSTLRGMEPHLSFVCDRTGVTELYLLDPDSGTLLQATSTRYGITDPGFDATDSTLYYSSLAPSDKPEAYTQGKMIYSTPVKDLPLKEVSFEDIHDYKVASALSLQEAALRQVSVVPDAGSRDSFSKPERFRKIIPTLHSWAPFFFNYDNVDKISGDDYYTGTSLGATLLFQNLTGEGYGLVGYGYHKDPDESGMRHSAHFQYIYTGWLPAIELSADYGDKDARSIMRIRRTDRETGASGFFSMAERLSDPRFEGVVRVFVPASFNSGGFSRGLIPQIKYKFTNDKFNNRISLQEIFEIDGKRAIREIGSLNGDKTSRLTTLDFSLRGYVLRNSAPSRVYPSLGLGLEAGLRTRPGLTASYSNTAFIYAYGYLPGFLQNQGLKLTAFASTDLGAKTYSTPESPIDFSPRGFVDSNLQAVGDYYSPQKYRISADYAIPLLDLDWSGLCPAAYVKNVCITPFADLAIQKSFRYDSSHVKSAKDHSERFLSLGADLTFGLGSLLWLPYDSSIGIRYAYNSWSSCEGLPISGFGHHYFEGIFSISL